MLATRTIQDSPWLSKGSQTTKLSKVFTLCSLKSAPLTEPSSL